MSIKPTVKLYESRSRTEQRGDTKSERTERRIEKEERKEGNEEKSLSPAFVSRATLIISNFRWLQSNCNLLLLSLLIFLPRSSSLYIAKLQH